MAFDMLVALLLIVSFLFLGHWYRNRNSTVGNWPVVGMLPALASNADRMLDFFTDMLKSNGGTFKIQGPWFASSDFLLTAHPMNINHIFCKNHGNYEKGPELRQILETYEGIITSDSDMWKRQKKALLSFFKYNKKSAAYMDRILLQVLQGSLIPVLEHFQTLGTEVDLEDVLGLFNYDYMCLLGFGVNPKTLSAELPVVEITEALGHRDDALVHTKTVPPMIWKLQKWLQIGKEKKLRRGLEMVDDFAPHTHFIKTR
ncbi:hypothetical protein F3Y22_tig00000757pilonHSYRG00010 [Hibiscus syriacus]|uniref:Cytochrome P450 n=1 Tax=Hibiscus syriacus TaxID=106335 RepID=A0A6A3D409_HIBSY|nr:cytochrome P450 86B1-like [Hibiscus syriacus]KAE8734578.1 hypothetical protein F3Y22_tig00000757pilonHSYRG00010 [Hibiscus syriacus]